KIKEHGHDLGLMVCRNTQYFFKILDEISVEPLNLAVRTKIDSCPTIRKEEHSRDGGWVRTERFDRIKILRQFQRAEVVANGRMDCRTIFQRQRVKIDVSTNTARASCIDSKFKSKDVHRCRHKVLPFVSIVPARGCGNGDRE